MRRGDLAWIFGVEMRRGDAAWRFGVEIWRGDVAWRCGVEGGVSRRALRQDCVAPPTAAERPRLRRVYWARRGASTKPGGPVWCGGHIGQALLLTSWLAAPWCATGCASAAALPARVVAAAPRLACRTPTRLPPPPCPPRRPPPRPPRRPPPAASPPAASPPASGGGSGAGTRRWRLLRSSGVSDMSKAESQPDARRKSCAGYT